MKIISRKYRPSNGSEGDRFTEKFCEICAKDVDYSCTILARTMVYGCEDKQYPNEWTYDAEGKPVCTAFEKMVGTR
mgnify:FL=1